MSNKTMISIVWVICVAVLICTVYGVVDRLRWLTHGGMSKEDAR